MEELREALDRARAVLAAGLDADAARGLRDDDLLGVAGEVEALRRRVDGFAAVVAGEVAERSRVELGSARLSARKGCRSVSELIERVTQVSGAEARRRVLVGSAIRERDGLTGHPAAAEFPVLAAAVDAGEIGADAAHVVVRELAKPRRVADPAHGAAAERALVAEATGRGDGAPIRATADELRTQAQAWAAFLDQDGDEPADERAMRRRGVRLGRTRDGLVSLTGELLPEVAAGLRRLFDAHLAPRSGGGFLTAAERADLERESEVRTPDQQRHDVVAGIIDVAARAADSPTIGGAPPTVLVSVRASDLESGHGVAHADGIDVPVSLRAARRMICTGGIQAVAVDDDGRILQLGSPERCFTPHQRRAITLRDGGCLIPGCSVPASWCEVHHVVPDVDGGPTHPDNGVLLCWFHHRSIDTSGWGIRMQRGSPWIRPPSWLDPDGAWRPAPGSRTRLADRIERERHPLVQ
ncbi:HNH endonuclease signature motif containing protein [Agromyces sp. SYSU T00194]|uniref:HNH endonuclease signature motif containing protein n=1 Tax=Agromyces chitinivorans TaxID=3158560 RepID=UPI0033910FC5